MEKVTTKRMALYSGRTHPALAEEVAGHLGIEHHAYGMNADIQCSGNFRFQCAAEYICVPVGAIVPFA